MKEVKFLEDYKVAEFPQYGGRIIDAKEGDIEKVSFELAEVLGSKVEDYVAPVESEDDIEDEIDGDQGSGPGENGEGSGESKPEFLG